MADEPDTYYHRIRCPQCGGRVAEVAEYPDRQCPACMGKGTIGIKMERVPEKEKA